MKRLLPLLLAMLLTLSLFAACKDTATDNPQTSQPQASQPDTTVASAPDETDVRPGTADLRGEFLRLYEANDTAGLEEFWSRVSFGSTGRPGECDEKYCFTNPENLSDYNENVVPFIENSALTLKDNIAGTEQTIAVITSEFAHFYAPSLNNGLDDGNITILDSNADTCLFWILVGESMGKYVCIYTISTNNFKMLDIESTFYTLLDEYIVGTSPTGDASTPVPLNIYDIEGNLLVRKEDRMPFIYVEDGFVYSIDSGNVPKEGTNTIVTQHLYKTSFNGEEEIVATIKYWASSYRPALISNDGKGFVEILIPEGDTYYMSVTEPHDVDLTK